MPLILHTSRLLQGLLSLWWEKEEAPDGSRVLCLGKLLEIFLLWDRIHPRSRWLLKVGNEVVGRCRNGPFVALAQCLRRMGMRAWSK